MVINWRLHHRAVSVLVVAGTCFEIFSLLISFRHAINPFPPTAPPLYQLQPAQGFEHIIGARWRSIQTQRFVNVNGGARSIVEHPHDAPLRRGERHRTAAVAAGAGNFRAFGLHKMLADGEWSHPRAARRCAFFYLPAQFTLETVAAP